MIKFLALAIFVAVVGYLVAQSTAFGQTDTPTPTSIPTPTNMPTTAVPSGAPATGFGPN